MKIKINGQDKELEDNLNLDALIGTVCTDRSHVIAELNGNIIKKEAWTGQSLSDGDTIELVSFVGGG